MSSATVELATPSAASPATPSANVTATSGGGGIATSIAATKPWAIFIAPLGSAIAPATGEPASERACGISTGSVPRGILAA